MEKETFYAHLNLVYELTGGKVPTEISLHRAAKITGHNERTLKADRSFPLNRRGKVDKIELARWMGGTI